MVVVVLMSVAYSFSHDLAALVIKHPFVTGLLETGAAILVHLLSLDDSITTADSSMSFGLVNFVDWSAILSHFDLLVHSLFDKVAI